MITISEIMTSSPLTLTQQHTLTDAAELMKKQRIRHIPVLDDQGSLAGLISERDLLAAQDSNIGGCDGITSSGVTLDRVMTRQLTTVDPNASVKTAAIYLQKHKFGCLPVVAENQLVGIVTDSDMIAVAINLLELQQFDEETPIYS